MNGRVYYNEFGPRTAAWLRQLIADGHLPAGDVDERSIEDVVPSDLRGYRQCHFFAGIGGWAHALALAGWPADRPVWTGSCPCQPFSAAGAGAGFADERHLWPAWLHLIAQCRPAVVFGEQVASAVGHGWIDLVQADMEGQGYAVGHHVLGAHSVGAPTIRQRIYWVASDTNADSQGLPREVQLSAPGASEAAIAWRAIERVHAARAWPSWLSESGVGALADGLPARVVRLRGYGNAIVPQVAAEFIAAAVEAWELLT